MAQSPSAKTQKLKENAIKNRERRNRENRIKKEQSLRNVWERTTEAGCTFYVNKVNGSAQVASPFETGAVKFCDLEVCNPRAPARDEDGGELATGYGVYEGMKHEFDKVMDFLEGRAESYE